MKINGRYGEYEMLDLIKSGGQSKVYNAKV
jgi:hypothetical protein